MTFLVTMVPTALAQQVQSFLKAYDNKPHMNRQGPANLICTKISLEIMSVFPANYSLCIAWMSFIQDLNG